MSKLSQCSKNCYTFGFILGIAMIWGKFHSYLRGQLFWDLAWYVTGSREIVNYSGARLPTGLINNVVSRQAPVEAVVASRLSDRFSPTYSSQAGLSASLSPIAPTSDETFPRAVLLPTASIHTSTVLSPEISTGKFLEIYSNLSGNFQNFY